MDYDNFMQKLYSYASTPRQPVEALPTYDNLPPGNGPDDAQGQPASEAQRIAQINKMRMARRAAIGDAGQDITDYPADVTSGTPGSDPSLRSPSSGDAPPQSSNSVIDRLRELAGGSNNPMSQQMSEYLQDMMDKQKKGIDDSEATVNAYKDAPTRMNLAPLLALTDTWTGSNLSKGYQAPESAEEKAQNVAKLQSYIARQRGDFSKEAISNLLGTNRNDALLMKAITTQGNRDTASDAKASKQDITEEQNLLKQVDPDIQRSGNFGALSQQLARANKIGALFGVRPSMNLSQSETVDMSSAVASLINNSNAVTDAAREGIIPHSAVGSAQAFMSWLTNAPKNTEQQQFIKRLAEDARAEQNLLISQIKQIQTKRFLSNAAYKKKHPDSWRNMVIQYDLDPDNLSLTPMDKMSPIPTTPQAEPTAGQAPDTTRSPKSESALEAEMRRRGLVK